MKRKPYRYCNRQITAEKRMIAGNIWEHYACGNNACTKHGMSRASVETYVLQALASITIDNDLCQCALDNILRDLQTQTEPITILYEQQNRTLADIEKALSRLAEMWINGLMTDAETYKAKESELVNERNILLLATQAKRNELERMRENAKAAANYVVYARGNFIASGDAHKRRIAHALGSQYIFYGKEKEITVQVHPLLTEFVAFANLIKHSLEVVKAGYSKQKQPTFEKLVVYGGPYRTRTCHLLGANEALYQMS